MRDLFTVGPVNMFERTLRVASRPIPYFRNEAFSVAVKGIEKNLKAMMGVPEDGRVILLTTSGTGGMEATVANLVTPASRVLVVNGGTFGARFAELVARYGGQLTELNLAFEQDLTREMLERTEGRFDFVFVNIHETSIGKLYDGEMLGEFARSRGAMLVVDAISSFLADAYDMERIGADVTLVGSQKALALDAGLCVVALSARAAERAKEVNTPSLYFHFPTYLKDAERGQTPFTPAVGTVLELEDRLRGIAEEGGTQSELSRVSGLASYFRAAICDEGLPFRLPPYRLSQCLTPLLLQNGEAQALNRYLTEKYDIHPTPCGGAYRDTMLRIGHIGAHTQAGLDRLVAALKEFYR